MAIKCHKIDVFIRTSANKRDEERDERKREIGQHADDGQSVKCLVLHLGFISGVDPRLELTNLIKVCG